MKSSREKILILAAYSIMAVLLFLVESMIPKPLPFIRIGLANVFILLILVQIDFFSALVVALTKSHYRKSLLWIAVYPAYPFLTCEQRPFIVLL